MQKEGGKMVYWKLDNHTIRCLINKEEIKKMGFDLNDISKDADVMTEFLEAIVSDSHNYIDWNTENGVQIYIAKALPADQFLFTISCSFPDDMIDQDLRQIRRMINALNDKIPLDRLDEIVSLLEENEQPLNQSIDLFEEGLKLVRHCDDMLKKFEERIEEIKSRNGGAEDEEL